MKKLLLLLTLTSAFFYACGNDDNVPNVENPKENNDRTITIEDLIGVSEEAAKTLKKSKILLMSGNNWDDPIAIFDFDLAKCTFELPETVPDNLLFSLYADLEMEISDLDAKWTGCVYFFLGDPDEVFNPAGSFNTDHITGILINTSTLNRSQRVEYIYVDRDVDIKARSEQQILDNDGTMKTTSISFDLKLKKGWNKVGYNVNTYSSGVYTSIDHSLPVKPFWGYAKVIFNIN